MPTDRQTPISRLKNCAGNWIGWPPGLASRTRQTQCDSLRLITSRGYRRLGSCAYGGMHRARAALTNTLFANGAVLAAFPWICWQRHDERGTGHASRIGDLFEGRRVGTRVNGRFCDEVIFGALRLASLRPCRALPIFLGV